VAVGGDIVVKADGKPITNAESLSSLIGSKKPGDTISVEVERATGNGNYEHKTVKVTLAARPNSVKNPNTPEG
jgi:S1-C subfamily serine protease